VIDGKVIDPSALVVYVRGSVAMGSRLAAAKELGIVLYVPRASGDRSPHV